MERVEKTVFISYRRTNVPWALAIFQNLTQSGFDVFFDYSGIASGDFESVIIGNIKARAHFLVLLTPSALERCDEPGDWLRREIETALGSRRNIVPLMLEGFDFGTPRIASQLKGKLAALRRYNGLSVPPDYFLEAMGRLRDLYLDVPLAAVLHPASQPAKRAASEQKAAADAAPPVKEKELTAQQWFERGFAATEAHERLRFYTQAIRLKPDYSEAFNNRGCALLEKKDIDGALKDINEAVQLNPENAQALSNRGIILRMRGDPKGAIKALNKAIRLKPDMAEAFVARGNARYDNGDLQGALEDYSEAIRLKPDYALALSNRGLTLREVGDLQGAHTDLKEAARLGYRPKRKNKPAVSHS
jgi:tetratricopeptide (TPR) repeat protein